MKLYNEVIALRELNENVKKDAIGTIVFEFGERADEVIVEFFNEKRETLDVLTVSKRDIQKVDTKRGS